MNVHEHEEHTKTIRGYCNMNHPNGDGPNCRGGVGKDSIQFEIRLRRLNRMASILVGYLAVKLSVRCL